MTSDVSTYRVFQCVEDLRALVLRGGPAPLVRIARMGAGAATSAFVLAAELDKLVSGNLSLPRKFENDLYLCLRRAVDAADTDPTVYETTLAVLLADMIQERRALDGVAALLEAQTDRISQLQPAVRSVLMRALVMVQKAGLVSMSFQPDSRDLQTRTDSDTVARLLDSAQSLAQAEMAELVRAGVRSDEMQRLERLLENLSRLGGAEGLADDVVLISPSMRDQADYLPRVALACWRAQTNSEIAHSMAQHWRENAPMILKRPLDLKGSILAGMRHLYETLPDWDPYPFENASPSDMVLRAIPWWNDPA